MTIKLDYDFHHEPFPLQYEVYRDCSRNRVVIDRVRQQDGSYKWAVRDGFRTCLSTEGEWAHESLPSNRPENWIATHRFSSLEEAWEKATVAAQTMLADYRDLVRAHNEREEQSADS